MAKYPPLHQYRLFPVNFSGRVMGLPDIIEAGDDDEAIQSARRLAGSRTAEVWSGARLVTMLNHRRVAEPSQASTAYVL